MKKVIVFFAMGLVLIAGKLLWDFLERNGAPEMSGVVLGLAASGLVIFIFKKYWSQV